MRIIHIIFALLILSIPVFFFKKVLDTNRRLIETNTSLIRQIQILESQDNCIKPKIEILENKQDSDSKNQ